MLQHFLEDELKNKGKVVVQLVVLPIFIVEFQDHLEKRLITRSVFGEELFEVSLHRLIVINGPVEHCRDEEDVITARVNGIQVVEITN